MMIPHAHLFIALALSISFVGHNGWLVGSELHPHLGGLLACV